jgi:hypothetical protein
VLSHAVDDLIGADGCMGTGDAGQYVAALGSQLRSTASAHVLGPAEKLVGAMAVIVAGDRKGHIVIL